MSERKATILYVDDDQGLLDAMRAVLESSGYAMVEARSGEEGLRVYHEQHPDFVIVDLMMEEVDAGTRLVKELKAAGNTVPVYLLSSVGDQVHLSIDPVALGLDGVFQKPLDPGVLLTTLKIKLAG